MDLKFFLFCLIVSVTVCQHFPQSCRFADTVIDCRDEYIPNIQSDGNIYNKIERLLFRRVVEFNIAPINFPNLKFVEITSTGIPCEEFSNSFPATTFRVNNQICEQVNICFCTNNIKYYHLTFKIFVSYFDLSITLLKSLMIVIFN